MVKHKELMLYRQRERRRLARLHKLRLRRQVQSDQQASAHALAPIANLPEGSNVSAAACLQPPCSLNLSANYTKTVQFLEDVRTVAAGLRGQFWVDFTKIEQITPAAALLLVAELDRWKDRTAYKRLSALDIQGWRPAVRKRLSDMGFFTVLNADCAVVDPDDPEGEHFLPFVTGHRSEGDKAKELRIAIESLGAKLKDSGALYDGLIEAMTNVEHHAYQPGIPESFKRWWMSASVNASKNRLTVMFVDHGLTIPRTLPKSDFWEQIRGTVGLVAGLLKDHAKLIEAAISVERSQLNQGHRGNGLKRDIQGYVEQHEAVGSLRIISGDGQYVFQKRSGRPDKIELKTLPVRFRGTFIEWVIEDYATSEQP
jgi:hypothetical protein